MKNYLRVWEKCDLIDIEKHLIVMGELSSECYSCHKVGIERRAKTCPECGVSFKYMGFRRRLNPAHLNKFKEDLPDIIFIDFEDFKKVLGKHQARKLFDS